MRVIETKFALGGYWKKVVMVYDQRRIFFHLDCIVQDRRIKLDGSGFSTAFNYEVKQMGGRQYHGYDGAPLREYCLKWFGRDRIWSAEDSQHNAFHIAFLEGKKPYARWKGPLITMPPEMAGYVDELKLIDLAFKLYNHQDETVRFILTRRQDIIAEEMGVGKTLAEMLARKYSKPAVSWYVAPRSALKATEREHRKWKMPWPTEMMTPQGLVKRVKDLEGQDFIPPRWLTLDEAHEYKNPTAQRSQAAKIMADAMREYWGDDCEIILMTGSPAPKSPLDWFFLVEIARPGYLIEGSLHQMKERLAILVDRDFGGGVHKHIEAWRDREDFCDTCGKEKANPDHGEVSELTPEVHEFKPGKNEVKFLYQRLDGLVIRKKLLECTDLPEMRYEQIILDPSHKMLQLARSIANTARTTALALTQLCTLSDGFLYQDVESGVECCSVCGGKKEVLDFELKQEFEGCTLPEYAYQVESFDDEGNPEVVTENVGSMSEDEWRTRYFTQKMMPCIRCEGKGEVKTYTRTEQEVETPKDDALRELIERHDEVGRFVTYAAFQGSVDRIIRIYQDMGWQTIRWDGRGVHCSVSDIDPLDLFQDMKGLFPKVGFIGHPRAAGMGLTLTASPGACFYSNTFNAVDRLQASKRIHRLSMDIKRGATTYDLFHLPTDRLVFNNISEKIARQELTLGIDVDMAEILRSLQL